jgi:outer membrane protein OmpA-like peptidoglycan-associated protein
MLGVLLIATACRTSPPPNVKRIDHLEKQSTLAKTKPVKRGQTVSSGQPQKNSAVAVIMSNDVGGDEGEFISNQMDAQALEIGREKLSGGSILRIGEGIKITYDGTVLFAPNTFVLTEAAKKDLRRIAATLNEYNNNTRLVIEGHTDGSGSEQNNLELSRARAKAVAEFLLMEKVPASKIEVIGYGEQQPLFSNATEEGRRQNKRIEIVIIADDMLRDQAKKGP